MAEYRHRTWRLLFGRCVVAKGKTKVDIPKAVQKRNESDSGVYEISSDTGFANIEFDLQKDNSKEPNKGYVVVYNLSDDTVNYLDAHQADAVAVLLEAGYDNDNQVIFSGTVEFVEDTWDGPTRKTKLIFGDGTENIIKCQTTRSYAKGTPMDTVLNDLLNDMNLPRGRVVKFGDQTLQYSMAFSGNTAENLRKFARLTNSNFSVQDGAVYWTKTGKRFKDSVFEISAETGMHGSPTPKNPEPAKKRKAKAAAKKGKEDKSPITDEQAGVTGKKKGKKKNPKEDVGLTVTTVLNGAIIPESTIYLKSRKYTGFYKVITVHHKGQVEGGGDWVTELGLGECYAGVIEDGSDD